MNFWDSSAIIPLFVEDEQTPQTLSLLEQDAEIWVWWGTFLECRTALARRFREKKIDIWSRNQAIENLLELSKNWHEIQPSYQVRDNAVRLVDTHSLRAADSLQLAAALVASGGRATSDGFVTFDQRLGQAAMMEGYKVPIKSGYFHDL